MRHTVDNKYLQRGRAAVARRPHKAKVDGANPSPAILRW